MKTKTMMKQKFEAFIAAIEREELRLNVEDSARTNANDTMRERGYQPSNNYLAPWGEHEEDFWEVAQDTAEMILDDWKSYYPELVEVRMYAITTGTHWFKGGRWTLHEWEADLFDSAEAAWAMLAGFPSVRADYASVVPV